MTLTGLPILLSLILLICVGLCLYRVLMGPTSADRIIAIDMMGIIIICYCALSALFTHREFLMDIAVSWAILGFIGTLSLAKYLEGKGFDD